jgi:hypothetical protein
MSLAADIVFCATSDGVEACAIKILLAPPQRI